jgi:hypothetical protein
MFLDKIMNEKRIAGCIWVSLGSESCESLCIFLEFNFIGPREITWFNPFEVKNTQ